MTRRRYFLDECISPKIARALVALDDAHDISYVGDADADHKVERGAEDVVWIPIVAKLAYIGITTDTKQRRREDEIAARKKCGARTVFLPAAFPSMVRWDQVTKFFEWWPRIEDATRSMGAGVTLLVGKNGKIEAAK